MQSLFYPEWSSSWPVGAEITGVTSGATGSVVSYNNSTLTLILDSLVGTFLNGENIIGESTGGGIDTVEVFSNSLLDETYIPDEDGLVTIELREFFEKTLNKVVVPDIAESSYHQAEAYGQFNVTIDATELVFYVVFGGGKNLLPTIGERWHTWQEPSKRVKLSDPEWLTFFSKEESVVRANIYHDGGIDEIEIEYLSPDKFTSVQVTPSLIGDGFSGVYKIEVWVSEPISGSDSSGLDGDPISNVQTYIITRESFDFDDLFLFSNSLGGVDTIRFHGALEQIEQFEIDTALLGREDIEYFSESARVYNKTTGIFRSRWEMLWARDFFASITKYRYQYEQLTRIKTTGSFPSVRHLSTVYEFQFAESEPDTYQNHYDFYGLPEPPQAPSNLVAISIGVSEISLTWDDNSITETSFLLQRSTSSDFSSGVAEIPGIPSNSESYTDTALLDATVYYYRLKAVGSEGSSSWSNIASATTVLDFGKALRFDGNNDYINLSSSDLVGESLPDSWSYSLWFRHDYSVGSMSTLHGNRLLLIGTTGGSNQTWQLQFLNDPTFGYCFNILMTENAGATQNDYIAQEGGTFDNDWHHLVITRELVGMYYRIRCYLDGTQQAWWPSGGLYKEISQTEFNQLSTYPANVSIGGSSRTWLGCLNEISFIHKRLSLLEVQSLYNDGKGKTNQSFSRGY